MIDGCGCRSGNGGNRVRRSGKTRLRAGGVDFGVDFDADAAVDVDYDVDSVDMDSALELHAPVPAPAANVDIPLRSREYGSSNATTR